MRKGMITWLTQWPVLAALGLLAGASVGMGIVEAAHADYEIDGGLNYYPGPGSSDYTVMEEASYEPGSFPNHKFQQLFKLEADSDFPGATELDFSFGTYRYAQGGSSGDACFWYTRFWDEDGENHELSQYWKRVAVDETLNDARNISWEYDGFEAGNKNMNVTQLMVAPAPAGSGCDGYLTAQGLAHYTTWKVY